ncbi:MAG: hypothetical protein K2X66_10730, partial [Cyanobacteria bacterium]|nr:hypothetical protein [Cyanobacteriota bacterium]
PSMAQPNEGRIIQTQDGIIYLPSALQEGKRYPALFAFSPNADAPGLIQFWKSFAENHQWIIYASKEYRNYTDVISLAPLMKEHIDSILQNYAVDRTRIIFTGMSGGGSFSHMMNLYYPGTAAALIVNTGRIWDMVYSKAYYEKQDFGNSRRLIVFLASPTDFRYQEMKRDYLLMQNKGWHVQWIEFEGGHQVAPIPVYNQAIQWIESHPQWH